MQKSIDDISQIWKLSLKSSLIRDLVYWRSEYLAIIDLRKQEAIWIVLYTLKAPELELWDISGTKGSESGTNK